MTDRRWRATPCPRVAASRTLGVRVAAVLVLALLALAPAAASAGARGHAGSSDSRRSTAASAEMELVGTQTQTYRTYKRSDGTFLSRVLMDPRTNRAVPDRDCTISRDSFASCTSEALQVLNYESDVAAQSQALLHFDVGQAVPENARILQASMYLSDAGFDLEPGLNQFIAVSGAAEPWTTRVSWATPDGIKPWTDPMSIWGGASVYTTAAALYGVGSNWFTADITSLTRDWISGLYPNYGIVLSADYQSDTMDGDWFNSSEVAGAQPYIDILYEPRVDDVLPDIDVSGNLIDRDIDSGYVGSGTYSVTVVADDTPDATEPSDQVSGIKRVELVTGDGGVYAVQTPSCTPVCPVSYTATFTVNTATIADGFLDLDVVAVDGADNVMTEGGLFVVVDKSRPSNPDRLVLRDFDPATSTVVLDWREGSDPPLGPEIAGSGLKHTEYRLQASSGAWGAWQTVSDGSDVLLRPVAEEQVIAVQLRTMDAAGNYSATASGYLTVRAEASTQSLSDRELRAVEEARTANDAQPCPPRMDYGRARTQSPDFKRFRETKVVLGMQLKVFCLSSQNHPDKLEITGRLAYDTGGDNAPTEVGEPSTVTINAPPPNDDEVKVRGFNATCELRMRGSRDYVVTGTVKYIRDGAVDYTASFTTKLSDAQPLTCPGIAQRLGWQERGWQHLSRYSSEFLEDPDKRAKRKPSAWLANALGDRPYTPSGVPATAGWQAHHTILVGRPRRARDLHALLFRACVHPNERGNGIYLRARALRRRENDGSPNERYTRLRQARPDLADRTYHGDTFRFLYLTRLREGLQDSLGTHNDKCGDGGAGGRSAVLSRLSSLADDLIDGTMELGDPKR